MRLLASSKIPRKIPFLRICIGAAVTSEIGDDSARVVLRKQKSQKSVTNFTDRFERTGGRRRMSSTCFHEDALAVAGVMPRLSDEQRGASRGVANALQPLPAAQRCSALA